MAGSVIDSLVVTLGLDSKGFAEGIKGSTDQLASFTKRLAGMFLAVKGLEDVVGYFKDLHAQLAEIGFTSKNLGVAGTELMRLGEVSQLFGGQMQDAADSVESLQSAVFALKFKGQMSEGLMMLQRFGVAYLDAAGHARKFEDVARDAAAAIDRQAKVAGLDKGERYQMALSMQQFTGGMASAVAQGGKELEDALKAARSDQKSLTDKTINGQVQLDRDLTRLADRTATQSSVILSRLTPALEHLTQWAQKLANDLLPKIVHAIDGLENFLKNPPPWFKGLEDVVKSVAQMLGPIGTLAAALGTLTVAVGAGSALVSGIAALGALLAPLALAVGAGLVAGKVISNLPSGGLLDKLTELGLDYFGPGSDYGKKPGSPSAGVAHGFIARGVPPTPTAPRPASAAQQAATAGQPPPTAMTGGAASVTNNFENITINTRATDANGIATSLKGAVDRKFVAGLADSALG